MISFSNIVRTDVANQVEPVSLQEIKDWLKVDHNDDDEMLMSMRTGARQSIQEYLGWPLVSQTVTLDLENPKDTWDTTPLPYARAVSTVVVNEMNDSDVLTLQVVGTDYYLRANTLRLGTGRFAVSYTSVPGSIPEAVKEAIKMEVAERYRHRGENDADGGQGLSEAAKDKCSPYSLIWL